MAIEDYHFGSITIDGETYNYDVEVKWGKPLQVLDWRRERSHIIDVEDIQRAVSQNPEFIIIGTGESGVARLTQRAKEEIESRSIKLLTDITGEAVKMFNRILKEIEQGQSKQRNLIGLFHLTC